MSKLTAAISLLVLALWALLLPVILPIIPPTEPPGAALVQGQAWQPHVVVGAGVSALADECAADPLMLDHRSADDPSYSILRRLEAGNYDFARAWAGFQASDQHGCRRAQPGQRYLDLAAVELKCGPAVLQAQTLDEAGAPKSGMLVFLNWPDAESFPVDVDPPLFPNGVGGFTDAGGSVGFGFGAGSQLTPGVGGPFGVWASSDPQTWPDRIVGSDALLRDGWFDNHCVFNPIFQVRRKAGDVPPPDSGAEYLVHIDATGAIVSHIPLTPGAPGAGAAALGVWRGGAVIEYAPWTAGEPPQ